MRQIIQESFDDFVSKVVMPNNIYAKWCDGILFTYWPAPRSEVIANAESNGVYTWEIVIFTKSEKNPITLKKNQGMVELPVEDVSRKKLYREFVAWLKDHDEIL